MTSNSREDEEISEAHSAIKEELNKKVKHPKYTLVPYYISM